MHSLGICLVLSLGFGNRAFVSKHIYIDIGIGIWHLYQSKFGICIKVHRAKNVDAKIVELKCTYLSLKQVFPSPFLFSFSSPLPPPYWKLLHISVADCQSLLCCLAPVQQRRVVEVLLGGEEDVDDWVGHPLSL